LGAGPQQENHQRRRKSTRGDTMNWFNVALEKDIHEDVLGAVGAYEKVIQQNGPVDAYMNLAFICWQSTEYGFNAAYHLPLEFIKLAGERYPKVLQKAETLFPDTPEIEFWKLYFDYMTLGADAFTAQCERLVAQPNCSLVPYFYLYSMSDGRCFEDEAMDLLKICKSLPTLKNQYIASVIEATWAFLTRHYS